MRVDFNQMQEMTLPCPHQGTGQMSLRAYVGQGEIGRASCRERVSSPV